MLYTRFEENPFDVWVQGGTVLLYHYLRYNINRKARYSKDIEGHYRCVFLLFYLFCK